MQFFEQLLPEYGYICVARALPSGGFAHAFFDDLDTMNQYLLQMDGLGHTMYLAQSSFNETALQNHSYNKSLPRNLTPEQRKEMRKPERIKLNVHAVRSFWFDIDSGAEKFAKNPNNCYPDQVESLKALRVFCRETGLPHPTIVNSGNGLYAHWFMDRDISGNEWTATATILKEVAEAFGFKADPSRTSDSASVLRPPGTTNRKNGNAKPVKVCGEITAPISYDGFVSQLILLAKEKKLSLTPMLPPKHMGVNDQFLSGLGGPPSSAHAIAEKCSQMRVIRDTQGYVDEPFWYAAIGVLKYTEESPQVIHDWSAGHPEYDPKTTDAKIAHWGTTPPATCYKLGASNPQGCVGCLYKDKIKSPIVLGYPEPAAVETPEEAAAELPEGFTMAADGLYFDDGDLNVKFFGQALFPTSVAWDHSLGFEVATFRHKLPHDGWRDFALRSSIVHDPKALLSALHDNHVQVIGKKEKGIMTYYVESYLDKVRNTQRLSQLFSQMGWVPVGQELRFVLGQKVFAPGREESAGLAKNIPEVARAFSAVGDSGVWSRSTEILGTPGMEPLAFALMAGAFGAPLLRFTGFAGAMLSLVGPSGAGKSLVGNWVLSAYGDPIRLTLLRDDTRNMLISRLGLYGSLPLYIDEITNIEPLDLSDLVYRVTQGRDKGRLSKNAVERASINHWNTIAITSSNASLIDKLGYAKADASAEINRVFEYRVEHTPQLTKEIATGLYRTMMGNYGGVGEAYVKWLVENTARHTQSIDMLAAKIDAMAGVKSEERFWSAIAATAVYGGMVAKNLGLIRFEIAPVLNWLVQTVHGMRGVKQELAVDSVSILGQFLDKNSPNVLIVNDSGKRMATMVRGEHRGALVARLEMDTLRLYISREELRKHLFRSHVSYDLVKSDLVKEGALKRHDIRKTLGAGTPVSGVQQACWEVDLSVPALGHVRMALVNGKATTGGVNAGFQ